MLLASRLLLALSAAATTQQHSAGFAPGWNKQAERPPMGWRHWNAFGSAIRAGLPGDGSNCSSPGRKCGSIARQIDQLTARLWDVDGHVQLASLLDVGYARVGIDEGWEDCGAGVGGRGHHDAAGNPLIDTVKFPDMQKLVEYAHGKNMTMGWYLNGCACPDHEELEINYLGDMNVMHALGFDEAKFDGCGVLRNSSKYAALMRTTWGDEPLPAVENCHWGAGGSIGCRGTDDDACPTDDWCPWNWFRVGGDQDAAPDSWFDDLQNVVQFNVGSTPLSRPQCWAYPDMMEVGSILHPNHTLDVEWNRAHFGAWCIVSSPLILGMDMDDPNLALVIPFITNSEAIAVNQQYAGSPGVLLQSNHVAAIAPPAEDPPPAPHTPKDELGFVVYIGMLNQPDDGGKPLRVANMSAGDAEVWCNQTAACTCFTAETTTTSGLASGAARSKSEVRFENEPLLCASNGIHVRNNDNKWRTWVKAGLAPDTAESGAQQVWGKPQPNGSWAFVLLNSDLTRTMTATIDLAALPLAASKISSGGAVMVRDIWAKANVPTLKPAAGLFTPPAVAPRDSAFYLVSPAS
jgi:alpha-galactosidase